MTRDELVRRLTEAGFEKCGHPPLSGLAKVVDEATGEFLMVYETHRPDDGVYCGRYVRRPDAPPETPYTGERAVWPGIFGGLVTAGEAWNFVKEHLPTPASEPAPVALRMAREFNRVVLGQLTGGDPALAEEARRQYELLVTTLRRQAESRPPEEPLFHADGVPVYRRDFERLVLGPSGAVYDARAWLHDRVAAYGPDGRSRQAQAKDACEVCKGAKGGTPGNENILVVNGKPVVVCDYCHAAHLRQDDVVEDDGQ